MGNFRRVFAWIGIIVLVGLYLITFITSFFAGSSSHNWFAASMAATVIIPILLYTYNLIYRVLSQRDEESRKREELFMQQISEELQRKNKEKEAANQAKEKETVESEEKNEDTNI